MDSSLCRPINPIYRGAHTCPQFFVDPWLRSNGKFFFILSRNIFSLIFWTFQFFIKDAHTNVPSSRLQGFLLPLCRRHAYHAFSNSKIYDILSFGVSIAPLPHRHILVFSPSISIKLPILCYRCSYEENPPLSSSLYTNSGFCPIYSIHIHVFLDKEFSSLFCPSNSTQK